MKIALIAALSENGVIGYKNALPWHLPEELQYFKHKTLGKPVIMGRKTFESIGHKPLPHRVNIIVSTRADFQVPSSCVVVNSVTAALKAAGECEEVMVIGGSQIFEAFLPIADRLYLSFIHQTVTGDTYFPSIDWEKWEIVSEQIQDNFTAKIFDKRVY